MSSQQLDDERIFHVAREIAKPDVRAEYLDQACAGDLALRERVESLLQVHEQESDFLKSAPDAAPTLDYSTITESPGQHIGRYRLMEQVGEGGMGVVFVAEQERPIRRKVALKVIKPGMDSKAVVARFEAERQALALMDHPNIAKVLDAGTTESGRPYFVMELVRGIPITEYCDQHKLTIRERLELFTQVCLAIQHAHQKAIIHRDIKPTNVLVTEQDGKPVPKVIDFGVAKALNQRLTERTIYTSFAQVVGTPLYMSPEQAALSAVDVDTRSDVYSLGVLLYELLTGTTPFDRERFEQAAYDEIRRIVREEEPPKPSTKISTLGDERITVAQNRRTDQDKLGRSVRGDLDWIVMKALEKERGRRYESASRFADDVCRFLNDRPVDACPPSVAYRAQKFLKRNRMAASVSAAMAGMLLTATIASTSAGIWALRERATTRVALRELKEQKKSEALQAAMSGLTEEAEVAASKAVKLGASVDWKRMIQGITLLGSGRASKASAVLSKDLNQPGAAEQDARAIREAHATSLMFSGKIDEVMTLEPNTGDPLSPEEALFKAQTSWFVLSSGELHVLLEQYYTARGDTGVGRMVIAFVKAAAGAREGNLGLVDQATVDSFVACELMPESKLALGARIYANYYAYFMHLAAGDNLADIYKNEAVAAAERIREAEGFAMAHACAAWMYERLDDVTAASIHWKNIGNDELTSFFRASYAQFEIRQNRPENAIQLLESGDHGGYLTTLTRAILYLGKPEKRDKAIADLSEQIQKPGVRVYEYCLLKAAGAKFDETSFLQPDTQIHPAIAEYFSDGDRQAFERTTSTSKGYSQFVVAMKLYTDGQTEEAIKMLREVADRELEPVSYSMCKTIAFSIETGEDWRE